MYLTTFTPRFFSCHTYCRVALFACECSVQNSCQPDKPWLPYYFIHWLLPDCCRRTAYAKIQVRLQFPDGYPEASPSPIVELKSDSLPQPFLRKLTKAAEESARNCPLPTQVDGDKSGGNGKAVAALKVVVDAVSNNKFLPCWKELRQAATLVTSR